MRQTQVDAATAQLYIDTCSGASIQLGHGTAAITQRNESTNGSYAIHPCTQVPSRRPLAIAFYSAQRGQLLPPHLHSGSLEAVTAP